MLYIKVHVPQLLYNKCTFLGDYCMLDFFFNLYNVCLMFFCVFCTGFVMIFYVY